MKRLLFLIASLFPIAAAQAEGHASATWLVEKGGKTDGVIRTAIRVKVDEGWHTYWVNPGQVGMPFSLDADLPEGWEAGEIHHPAPKRITVSGLVSFCHEGEFMLPITLTPPAGFEGALPPLTGTLNWLACNDDACVPGKAELTAEPETDEGTVAAAFAKLPKPIPGGASLAVAVESDAVSLTLTLPDGTFFHPASCKVFPITRNIIDPGAEIVFAKSPDAEDTWKAKATKDEYLPDKIGAVEILLVAEDGGQFVVGTE